MVGYAMFWFSLIVLVVCEDRGSMDSMLMLPLYLLVAWLCIFDPKMPTFPLSRSPESQLLLSIVSAPPSHHPCGRPQAASNSSRGGGR
jgi:hypothetical protein